jgi:hypothetical protein
VSNYTPTVNFAAKDTLISGNPTKQIKGAEITNELSAISTAINLYLPPGVGGVATSITGKLAQTVSVFDFMTSAQQNDVALNIGSIDVTAAIQAAINVVQVNGGVVYLPQGQYKISATLAVADVGTGVYIQGAGVGTTTILPTALVTVALKFGVAGTINQGFSNLTIDCKNATSCTAVQVNNIEFFCADNFLINQANIGISIVGGVVQFYTRWNINRSISYGVLIVGGGDQYFDTGIMSNVGFIQAVVGINIQNSGGVWLSNLDIISQGNGILLDPGNGQSVDWLFAVNVAFDTNAQSGINIQPSGTGSVLGCDFTACWSASGSSFGVFIGGTGTTNGVRFNGLRCQNNQQHGIVLSSGSTISNTNISNCDVSGNGAPISPWSSAVQYSTGNLVTLSGTTYQCVAASLNNSPPNATFWSVFVPSAYNGILVGANVSAFTIQGNRVGAESGYTATQATGIIVSAGSSNNYSIQGNDVRGNSVTGLSDSGTGTTKIVSGNLGYNPIGSVAITVGASPFTFTNNTGAPIAVLVNANGATISSITIEGQGTGGVNAGQFIVPQGAAIVVTYSGGTPQMVYFGL